MYHFRSRYAQCLQCVTVAFSINKWTDKNVSRSFIDNTTKYDSRTTLSCQPYCNVDKAEVACDSLHYLFAQPVTVLEIKTNVKKKNVILKTTS